MLAVAKYESKYVNAIGHWAIFHEGAIDLRLGRTNDGKMDESKRLDVWGLISVRFALRVVELRTECYMLASNDPKKAKLMLPDLEKRTNVAGANDLQKPLQDLQGHTTGQLMKMVHTLSASNATKRARARSRGATSND